MTESTSGPGKKPLAVYAILERKDRKHWFKIGAAFSNRDGSINLYLDALPVGTNCLHVREQRVWEEESEQAAPHTAGPQRAGRRAVSERGACAAQPLTSSRIDAANDDGAASAEDGVEAQP